MNVHSLNMSKQWVEKRDCVMKVMIMQWGNDGFLAIFLLSSFKPGRCYGNILNHNENIWWQASDTTWGKGMHGRNSISEQASSSTWDLRNHPDVTLPHAASAAAAAGHDFSVAKRLRMRQSHIRSLIHQFLLFTHNTTSSNYKQGDAWVKSDILSFAGTIVSPLPCSTRENSSTPIEQETVSIKFIISVSRIKRG
jgi:hypothetical protein